MPIADRDTYTTAPDRLRSVFSKIFLSPKFMFYPQVFWIVWTNSRKARRGVLGNAEWAESSLDILRTLENVGVRLEITGMENLRRLDSPVVFVGNHMSTLETFILPGIIEPVHPVTFVVKKSLVKMPVFGPIMCSREPIVIRKISPREDLRTVIEEGRKKLNTGRSIIIFPQGARSVVFDPADFNTLAIKLALRAGVPVLPIALKTDAWGVGKYIKDFGPIEKKKKVYFAFGEPMNITGRGADEHQRIIQFIKEKLEEWNRGDK